MRVKRKGFLKGVMAVVMLLGVGAYATGVEANMKPVSTQFSAQIMHSFKLTLNGTELKTAVKPYVRNGVAYVPLNTVLKALGYPVTVQKNQLKVKIDNRNVVVNANQNTILVNGKKVKLKAKVIKKGSYFLASVDTVSKVVGKGTTGYYANSKTISIKVPVYAGSNQATKIKFSPEYRVKGITFDTPSEWKEYFSVGSIQKGLNQERWIPVYWNENGVETQWATIFVRDTNFFTAKEWKEWLENGLESLVLKENGVMVTYIIIGGPTEELLQPENEQLFRKIADMINNHLLSDVLESGKLVF